MDEPCSRAELRACLRDLAWVNRVLFGYRPIVDWLDSLDLRDRNAPVRILDVGCGYGDTLRRLERWARWRGVPVELTGLDLNPDATAIAQEATPPGSCIHWVTSDVFAYVPPESPHIVVNSLFTHHLSDPDICRFLVWIEERAQLGWFINDLVRHPTPYRLFHWFSRLMRLHPFVQHDGPVSIARSFTTADWWRYCALSGLNPIEIEVRGYTPGRLCVSRRRPQ